MIISCRDDPQCANSCLSQISGTTAGETTGTTPAPTPAPATPAPPTPAPTTVKIQTCQECTQAGYVWLYSQAPDQGWRDADFTSGKCLESCSSKNDTSPGCVPTLKQLDGGFRRGNLEYDENGTPQYFLDHYIDSSGTCTHPGVDNNFNNCADCVINNGVVDRAWKWDTTKKQNGTCLKTGTTTICPPSFPNCVWPQKYRDDANLLVYGTTSDKTNLCN